MSTGQALLEQQDEDAGELSYTDKQVAIVRAAVQNPDADVNEIADMSDSHVTYVRSVLDRADTERVQEELGLHEEQDEATDTSEAEAETDEEVSEDAETQEAPEESHSVDRGEQADAVPVTVMVPRDAINEIADAISGAAGTTEQTEEPTVPDRMAEYFAQEFDVPENRARHIVLRIGTERAEEIMGEASEAQERAEEIAEQAPEQ